MSSATAKSTVRFKVTQIRRSEKVTYLNGTAVESGDKLSLVCFHNRRLNGDVGLGDVIEDRIYWVTGSPETQESNGRVYHKLIVSEIKSDEDVSMEVPAAREQSTQPTQPHEPNPEARAPEPTQLEDRMQAVREREIERMLELLEGKAGAKHDWQLLEFELSERGGAGSFVNEHGKGGIALTRRDPLAYDFAVLLDEPYTSESEASDRV